MHKKKRNVLPVCLVCATAIKTPTRLGTLRVLGILAPPHFFKTPTDFFSICSYKCSFRQPHSTEGYLGSTRWPLYRQSVTLFPFLQQRPLTKKTANTRRNDLSSTKARVTIGVFTFFFYTILTSQSLVYFVFLGLLQDSRFLRWSIQDGRFFLYSRRPFFYFLLKTAVFLIYSRRSFFFFYSRRSFLPLQYYICEYVQNWSMNGSRSY